MDYLDQPLPGRDFVHREAVVGFDTSAGRRRASARFGPSLARRYAQRTALALLAWLATAGLAEAQTCVGDCNDSGVVEINELILGVNIALDAANLAECPSLDDGEGTVTIAQLIAAVNNALCGCGGCGTPGPSATPTPTGRAGTPTTTPTGVIETEWTVDNYEVDSSDCADVIEDAVIEGLEAGGSEFIVRQSGAHVEIEDEEGTVFEGTADPDGTVHVEQSRSDSVLTCEYDVDVEASANLSQSPTTATYDGDVELSGFCVGLDDCSLTITARWRRVDDDAALQ